MSIIGSLIEADKNNFKDFLFYDIEVFAEDAIIVFKDISGVTQRVFHNDFRGVESFIADKVLVGYNNYSYDDVILSYILDYCQSKYVVGGVKTLNDTLIQTNTRWHNISNLIFSLDCFQQINVAKSSLKKVEANIGLSIDESKVDFNIGRKLNEKELEETIKYCEQDVNATIAIFKLRWKSYFVPKLMVVGMLPEQDQSMVVRWNTTTITAYLLTGNVPIEQWDSWKLSENGLEDEIILDIVPEEVREMWSNLQTTSEDEKVEKKKKKKYSHRDLGCIIEFSQGGLHGVPDTGIKNFNNVKLLDVTSLYPNLVMKINVLGTSTIKYKNIVEQRVKVKHTDPILSNALKLVINSAYGLMKNEYSKLYNPKGALSVCIFGQIALYDLCCRLYNAGYTLININTDGVAFNGGDIDDKTQDFDYEIIQEEWEEDYELALELSEFKTWRQKDVNNYVAVYTDGKVKVKGAEVNHYFDPTDYTTDPFNLNAGVTWTSTNSKSIINKCIVDKLIYDIPFIDTIMDNLSNPILFQYVLQCGRTYIGTVDDEGNEYQKVNRVFATKEKGVTLKKKKEGFNPQFFPNAPENMFVFNDDLKEFTNFKDIVDIDFYVELAEEKYKLWE